MELKDRLKAARRHARLNQAQLAERSGLTQASISDLERGKSRTTVYIAQLAKACGVDALWLADGQGEMLGGAGNADMGAPLTTPFRQVKIVGTAQLGAEGYWTALSPSDGHVEIPTRDKDAYALRLRGDSMSPAIRSGWVAVCEPNSQLIPGEYVHIKLKGFDGEGESMVKELLYVNGEEISVMSINDAFGRRTLALADVEYIHPVPFIVAPSKIVH